MSSLGEQIAGWMRQQVAAAAARGLVVGLSGGVDSAVVARLCQLASPEAALGVLMPCHSDPQDEADAQLVARHFSLPVMKVALEEPYDALVGQAQRALEALASAPSPPADDIRARVPVANIKPRLRMTTLFFVANSLNYLVAGTGNRSEIEIGYFTKYGDGGVDLLPIGNLLKSEVLALAHQLGVPDRVVDKAPSAGLWLGQTDEGEMGFSYEELERYLTQGPQAVSPEAVLRIERLRRAGAHKRALPPAAPVR